VEQVSEMVVHIATAATEPSSATEEIHLNMDKINKLVDTTQGATAAQSCEQLT
jgi:hypothetical protein